jgi:hypothetical protein
MPHLLPWAAIVLDIGTKDGGEFPFNFLGGHGVHP